MKPKPNPQTARDFVAEHLRPSAFPMGFSQLLAFVADATPAPVNAKDLQTALNEAGYPMVAGNWYCRPWGLEGKGMTRYVDLQWLKDQILALWQEGLSDAEREGKMNRIRFFEKQAECQSAWDLILSPEELAAREVIPAVKPPRPDFVIDLLPSGMEATNPHVGMETTNPHVGAWFGIPHIGMEGSFRAPEGFRKVIPNIKVPEGFCKVIPAIKPIPGSVKVIKLPGTGDLVHPTEVTISTGQEPADLSAAGFIKLGGTYQHYKGGIYRVLTLATHTETGEPLVVYFSVENMKAWARPEESWKSSVEIDGQKVERFKLIAE